MTRDQIVDKVIRILVESGGSLQILDISKQLQFKSDSEEYQMLKDVLNMLSQQGVIEKNPRRRYRILYKDPTVKKNKKSKDKDKDKDKDDIIKYDISENDINYENGIIGIYEVAKKSGIVRTSHPDYPVVAIQYKNRGTALPGDTVRIKLIVKKSKKNRGEIIEIVERNINEITGTVDFDGNFYFLIPDGSIYDLDFLIPTSQLAGARSGDKVEALFTTWNNTSQNPQVKVIKIIGKANDPALEYESIIKEFNLPTEFPQNVENDISSVKAPTNKKVTGRLDLRKETIFTIDPITAKDFDDAISLKKLINGHYELGVHIADVSHYVTENSATDKEAYIRGNSVYLVDRVIPMLPEKLSNEICSLNEGVVRYTFSVIMEMDENIEVVNYNITPSIIKSKKRFNYEEVQNILDSGKGVLSELLTEINELTKRIRTKRIKEGSLNYDNKEYKYILNEEKEPIGVEIHQTTEATSLIEECMLLANRVVAKHIKQISNDYGLINKTLPFIYRVHDKADSNELVNTMDFIRSLGISVNTKEITHQVINNILGYVRYMNICAVVNQMLIRSMPKAVYSETNIGHFGLGFIDYTHFTSPIRRYSDLLVHRLLKEYSNGIPDKKRMKRLSISIPQIAAHISNTERTAMEAERASNKLCSVIYAQNMLGEIYAGVISGVTEFGFFVLLDEIYCEGLIHVRELKDDHYAFEAKKMRLKGKRHKRTFTLGDKVSVKITNTNINKRTVHLELLHT